MPVVVVLMVLDVLNAYGCGYFVIDVIMVLMLVVVLIVVLCVKYIY
jgi:hypothetical protein